MTQQKQNETTAEEFDSQLREFLTDQGATVDADAPIHVVMGHCCYRAGGTWYIAFLLSASDDKGTHKDEPFKCVGILPAHAIFQMGNLVLGDIEESGDDPVEYLRSIGIEAAYDASELDSNSLKGKTLQ